MFFKGSRYANVPTEEITEVNGRVTQYKRTRFIPDTPAQMGHAVAEREHLDHIAHRYYRDAERFWRIADANGAMKPDELTAQPGRIILIPASED